MKLYHLALLAVLACFMAACGPSDRTEEVKSLEKKLEKGDKWDEEQTETAIDIAIEFYKEQTSKMEDIILLYEKVGLKYYIAQYGDPKTIKNRKEEIEEAEKEADAAIKEVLEKYDSKKAKEFKNETYSKNYWKNAGYGKKSNYYDDEDYDY